ncbi:hypothetical protein [Pseudoalteromonas marina]|uniref:Uncharacterized protein n=1 Tax=Pseudoalteromonas marina TaxID=267375 RepID=A0ABT9FHZ1_9GAMM|nr:hypothetical protein [Pseudoalteromonas marina]MDP2566412.1 hypothetical protein [Pseudoalteromonas marina]
MSSVVRFLKYLLIPFLIVSIVVAGWFIALSGDLNDLDTSSALDNYVEMGPDEVLFTVVQVKPFIDLVQYGENGEVLEQCFMNYDFETLLKKLPIDIGLFCSDNDIEVKVKAVHGIALNHLENGLTEESDVLRLVVEVAP